MSNIIVYKDRILYNLPTDKGETCVNVSKLKLNLFWLEVGRIDTIVFGGDVETSRALLARVLDTFKGSMFFKGIYGHLKNVFAMHPTDTRKATILFLTKRGRIVVVDKGVVYSVRPKTLTGTESCKFNACEKLTVTTVTSGYGVIPLNNA